MNLTLYHVAPTNESVRPVYVIAPDLIAAARAAEPFVPNPRSITAVANNAYVGDVFPRFIYWKEPA